MQLKHLGSIALHHGAVLILLHLAAPCLGRRVVADEGGGGVSISSS